MNAVEMEVYGALIGLARSAIGNEDLVTISTLNTMIHSITNPTIDSLKQIEVEKRKLVPDCFYCTEPCGRTSNYILDINQDIEYEKSLIIKNLQSIIHLIKDMNSYENNEELFNVVFTSLFYLGEDDCDNEDYQYVIQQQTRYIHAIKK